MNEKIKNNFYLSLEKKSKFYSYTFQIFNEKDVRKLIEEVKKDHIKASHIVYAYRISTSKGLVERSFNAKEPQGTAGNPLLKALTIKNSINIIIIIARYYGGVKLGMGLLSRSYFKAAIEVLENTKFLINPLDK